MILDFKKKPFRSTAIAFGALALIHTIFYTFTGLSFVSNMDDQPGRQGLVVLLHGAAIVLGVICAGQYNDKLWD